MIGLIDLIEGLALRAFLEAGSWRRSATVLVLEHQLTHPTQFIILHSIHHSSFFIHHSKGWVRQWTAG
jgi:hypothetical protein